MELSAHHELHTVLMAVEVTVDRVPVVLVGDPLRRAAMRDAIVAIGGDVHSEVDWEAISRDWLAPATPRLFALDAFGAKDDWLIEALPRIEEAALASAGAIVITAPLAAIDIVAAAIASPRAQILCNADAAEMTAALMLAAQVMGHRVLHDGRMHENEAARLQRLNEEVARMAEVLSRLSQRGTDQRPEPAAVLDRHQSFEIKPIHDITIDAGEIRRAIKGRRLRDQFFGAGLFEEPGWDMMLDLFAAELERTQVSVSSLCIAAAVAPTTALRWITKLTEAGLFERQPDPFDRRRAYMGLSERASRSMRDYIASMRRAGLSLA